VAARPTAATSRTRPPTGTRPITETVKVQLTGKAKKAKASAAAARRAARLSGSPVALPDGTYHGTRKRSFAPRGRVAA
jgi:hypothetical protein